MEWWYSNYVTPEAMKTILDGHIIKHTVPTVLYNGVYRHLESDFNIIEIKVPSIYSSYVTIKAVDDKMCEKRVFGFLEVGYSYFLLLNLPLCKSFHFSLAITQKHIVLFNKKKIFMLY